MDTPWCRAATPAEALGYGPLGEASGFAWAGRGLVLSNNAFTRALGKLLPATAILEGTAAAGIPHLLEKIIDRGAAIQREVLEMLPSVNKWAPETKEKVKRIFYDYQSAPPETFHAVANTLVPEARAGLEELRTVMAGMRRRYVMDGVLDPAQEVTNYFPIYREILGAKATGTLMIERGSWAEGYFPKHIMNMIDARTPGFAKSRVWSSPEDYPKNIDFKDTLNLYTKQFGRHAALRENYENLQTLLQQTPEELKPWVADRLNFFLGNPAGPGGVRDSSRFSQDMRQLQFLRTIGGSILSPIVNTFQRLNTFAVASPSSFFQAFADVHNPEMLALAHKAGADTGLGQGLAKGGLEELAGGSKLSGFADKLSKGAGALFSISEKGNRLHAFMTGVREGMRSGVADEETLINMGLRMVNETQFIHSPANMIPAFQSDLGKTLGQFQTFRINQLHFTMKLLDGAIQGVSQGDMSKVFPAAKFVAASVVLGGPVAMTGYWGEEKMTRAVFGKAVAVPGVLESALGVSLGSQLGLGAIGAEDINSFMYFLPGPLFGYVQGLLGVALGRDMGQGFDISQIGRELTFQERVTKIASSFPIGGIQATRIIQALRLLQNPNAEGYEYRRGLDLGEVLGMKPASGDLLASKAASLEQVILQAAGLPPEWRPREQRLIERQTQMENAMTATQNRAADYIVGGKVDSAIEEYRRFNEKYSDQLGIPLSIETLSPASLQAAAQRRFLPPGVLRRHLSPAQAAAEPFAPGPFMR